MKISNSPEYRKVIIDDNIEHQYVERTSENIITVKTPDIFSSEQARKKYREYHENPNEEGLEFCEDFAYGVTLYLEGNKEFIEKCPNRVKFYEVLGL